MDYASACRGIEATGLVPRGAFHPAQEDAVPAMSDGRSAGTLVLVGIVGGTGWDPFEASDEAHDASRDPLDRWSRRVISGLAARLGAEPLFPFGGPTFLPFLRWARRAEAVHPSPIGPLIHPDYGLWHAYRGALAFGEMMDLPPGDTRPSPCDSCAERPCLTSCPVGAFGPDGYRVPTCIGHIGTSDGRECLNGGCLARRACPVGVAYRYGPEQMAFHMRAFLAANRQSGR